MSLDVWIPKCSPYVSKMVYDINLREFIIECVNNINDFTPHTRIICSSILRYTEFPRDDEDEYDDELVDGLLDLNWSEESKVFYIYSDKKEISLKLEKQPRREIII